jgi:hypothetical protein
MLLGIISDTHDNVAAIERATDIFEHEGVSTVIHCGDYIAPPVLPFFEGFELHGVLGNNDGELDGLEAGFRDLGRGSQLHGRLAELDLDGTSFAVLHGEDLDRVESLARSGDYEYVLYGHHHERDHREVGDATVINPGAHFPTVRDTHHTVAVLDSESGELTFFDV